jgi:hypothetical protein
MSAPARRSGICTRVFPSTHNASGFLVIASPAIYLTPSKDVRSAQVVHSGDSSIFVTRKKRAMTMATIGRGVRGIKGCDALCMERTSYGHLLVVQPGLLRGRALKVPASFWSHHQDAAHARR